MILLLRYLRLAVLRPLEALPRIGILRSLLRQPVFFDIVAVLIQYVNLRHERRIFSGDVSVNEVNKAAHEYNAGVTLKKKITMTRRAEEFYKILVLPSRDVSKDKLLIVGPRNVLELFIAWLYGYTWSNIKAIDLYSLHPKIAVMNMEAMTFEDQAFDAVAMSMTLGYAGSIRTAMSEVVRVLKPGGQFSFAVTYDPDTKEWPEEAIYDGAKIQETLHDLGMSIYYHSGFEKINAVNRLQTSHSFGAVKDVGTSEKQDPFRL